MHEHDPEVTLDSRIVCRTCGQVLESAEKQLGSFTSRRMAQSVVDRIVSEGRYTAERIENGFVVYTRSKTNIEEEVTIRRKRKRAFLVIERLSMRR